MARLPWRPLALLLVLNLLMLTGCAGKKPETLPLSAGEEQAARQLLAAFLAVKRPSALDADIRVTWDALGSKGGIGGSLQLQQPALLRFSANDPLGRPLFIAASDGRQFTLIDNRAGHVSQGTTDSALWHRYVPSALEPEDLFYFLGGLLPAMEGQEVTPTGDRQQAGFWYAWEDRQSRRHQILLDPQDQTMRRHLLSDARNALLLDLTYADYNPSASGGFSWPGLVEVTGKAVTGRLSVRMEQIYSHAPMNPATFRLKPPPHFTIEQVP